MMFQITKKTCGQQIIVATIESTTAHNALKQIIRGNENIAKLRKFGNGAYTVGRIGCFEFERDLYIVTEVIEANVPVIMMPIGW
jgi:hypothetical protein